MPDLYHTYKCQHTSSSDPISAPHAHIATNGAAGQLLARQVIGVGPAAVRFLVLVSLFCRFVFGFSCFCFVFLLILFCIIFYCSGCLSCFPQTAESFGVSAQIGSGAFREDGRVWCCWGYRLSLFCFFGTDREVNQKELFLVGPVSREAKRGNQKGKKQTLLVGLKENQKGTPPCWVGSKGSQNEKQNKKHVLLVSV